MKAQGIVLSLCVGATFVGLGCETVKKTTHNTAEVVTGDEKKFYPRPFNVVVDAVKDTARDLGVVKVSEEENGLTKDSKKRYTLVTRTKEDKKLTFIVVREDDTRTSVVLDTAAFTGNSFRNDVLNTLQRNLK